MSRTIVLIMVALMVVVLIIGALLFSLDQNRTQSVNRDVFRQAETYAAATVMAKP